MKKILLTILVLILCSCSDDAIEVGKISNGNISIRVIDSCEYVYYHDVELAHNSREYVYYHTFFKPIGYCWDHVRDFFSNIFSGAQRKGLLSRLLSGEQQSTEEVKVYPRSGVLNNGSQVDTGDFVIERVE